MHAQQQGIGGQPKIHTVQPLPLSSSYTPEDVARFDKASEAFDQPFELKEKAHDDDKTLDDHREDTRRFTLDVMRNVQRYHEKIRKDREEQAQEFTTGFFAEPATLQEWTQEEDEKVFSHREAMRNRGWKEKLFSFGRDIGNGLAQFLPNAASRSINKGIKAQSITEEEYEAMRQPTLLESVSNKVGRMNAAWKDFTSNFSLENGLNKELDASLQNGEMTPEEHASLRKPTVRERISGARTWLASKLSSVSENISKAPQEKDGGDGGSDGNGNSGDGGGNGNRPPKKRWGLVGGALAAAAVIIGGAAIKDCSQDKPAPSASTTAPTPTGSVSVSIHSLKPAPISEPDTSAEPDVAEKEEKKEPVIDQPKKVAPKPKAPLQIAPRKAKVVPPRPKISVEPKLTEKVEEKQQPKVAEKKPQPKEKVTSLHLYQKELMALNERIQDMERRMKFVYERHLVPKPARTIVSVKNPKIVPYNPKNRYMRCTYNCGTYDGPKIAQLLNEARALLPASTFGKNDTVAVAAKKITDGRKAVATAQQKIDEAERLFADEEKAAKRVYVANYIAFADIHQKHAREKLALVDRQLTQKGIPIDGSIRLRVGPKRSSRTVKNGRSSYTVDTTTEAQTYDLGALRQKLIRVEADLELRVSSFQPQDAKKTYQAISEVNATLDQIIPGIQRGHVSEAPLKVAKKEEEPSVLTTSFDDNFEIKVRPRPVRRTLIRPKPKNTKAIHKPKNHGKKLGFAGKLFQSMKNYASRTT